jgi:hypothetical protein
VKFVPIIIVRCCARCVDESFSVGATLRFIAVEEGDVACGCVIQHSYIELSCASIVCAPFFATFVSSRKRTDSSVWQYCSLLRFLSFGGDEVVDDATLHTAEKGEFA